MAKWGQRDKQIEGSSRASLFGLGQSCVVGQDDRFLEAIDKGAELDSNRLEKKAGLSDVIT